MSKTVTVILVFLALALIVYNATLIDYEHPLEGKSIIALIGIVAALCAIVLLLIYQTSKKIEKKIDEK
ncbi:hypothetical protein LVD13_12415 [Flavobacteriaceae bacterium D16]|nr:hypothetical protein [Flavobacteriaceae bacterium D16]